MESFSDSIRKFLPVTDQEIRYLRSLTDTVHIKKQEKIIREGAPVDYVYFIDKGLIRYYSEINGKEQTYRIFKEKMWVSEYSGFLSRNVSLVTVQAIEDCRLIRLHYDKMQEGYERSRTLERFGRKIAENLFVEEIRKNTQSRIKSPETRYLELLENDPDIIRRVPLKYIASILGIEPESLSRIRKRTAQIRPVG